MSDEPTDEGKLFASFERRNEFVSLQSTLLASDLTVEPTREENNAESDLLRRLSLMVRMPVDNVSLTTKHRAAGRVPGTTLPFGPLSRGTRHPRCRMSENTRQSLHIRCVHHIIHDSDRTSGRFALQLHQIQRIQDDQ